MMEHSVRAAIIGAGPAGIACGITLQRQGTSNLVLDQAVFPRDKTCAGLVTRKTLGLLEALLNQPAEALSGLFCDTVCQVSVYQGARLLARTSCDTAFHLVDRLHFDHQLVQAYRGLGGTLLEGQTGYAIDYDAKRVTLSDGSAIDYEYLVFADGALSQAHRDFSIQRDQFAFCVEAYLPRAVLPAEGLELYLGVVPAGYLWVFPHSDRVCVGLINQQQEEAFPYRQTLELFLLDQGVPTGDLQYKGAFVPYGKPVSQAKTPDNVLLVGDAGGFVDPIYGEGLYLALLSGMTAGRALSAQAPKQAFLKNMQPAIRMIQSGSRLQSILFVPAVQKRLMGKIQGRNRFLKYYCDHQVSDYQYKHTDVRIVRDYKKSR